MECIECVSWVTLPSKIMTCGRSGEISPEQFVLPIIKRTYACMSRVFQKGGPLDRAWTNNVQKVHKQVIQAKES